MHCNDYAWVIVVKAPCLDVVLGQLGVSQQLHGVGHQLHVALGKLLQLCKSTLQIKSEIGQPAELKVVVGICVTKFKFFDPLHSGQNQGFLSNGCMGCIYLVKILAHSAMLQCMSRYIKPP